jgi:hypothetical protein
MHIQRLQLENTSRRGSGDAFGGALHHAWDPSHHDPGVAPGGASYTIGRLIEHCVGAVGPSTLCVLTAGGTANAGVEPDTRRVTHVRGRLRVRPGTQRFQSLELPVGVAVDGNLPSVAKEHDYRPGITQRADVWSHAYSVLPRDDGRCRNRESFRVPDPVGGHEGHPAGRAIGSVRLTESFLQPADGSLEHLSLFISGIRESGAELPQGMVELELPGASLGGISCFGVDVDAQCTLAAQRARHRGQFRVAQHGITPSMQRGKR